MLKDVEDLVEQEAIRRIELGEADRTVPLDEALDDIDIDWEDVDNMLNTVAEKNKAKLWEIARKNTKTNKGGLTYDS